MGNYNPHAPYILGQEWVPIRPADFTPEEFTERGYIFRLGHTTAPVSGAYYVAQLPESRIGDNNVDFISVYPAATAKLTGPIKKVNVPVSAVAVTGSSIDITQGFQALNNISDDSYVKFSAATGGTDALAIQFDLDSYVQQLFGKRILSVTIRYTLKGTPEQIVDSTGGHLVWKVGFIRDTSTMMTLGNPEVTPITFDANSFTQPLNTIFTWPLKSTNAFWDASTSRPDRQRDVYPWRYQELARFRATESASTRLSIYITNTLPTGSNSAFLYFTDMEITYCEETRVRYGGRRTTGNSFPLGTDVNAVSQGPNFVRLLDTNLALGTSLTPGEYLVTLTHINTDLQFYPDAAPIVEALRELYQLPSQRGTNLVQTLVVDDEFTQNDTDVLTHITLHTAAGVVTGVHAYGQNYGAPVHTSTSPIQEIEDDPVGSAALFPQVRFYARRFGSTTVPLTITDVATGLSTASISVADFDALPEIVDGWREVTLRFATAPSFATTAGDIDWKWTAAGELVGNQWQILAASGPSPTGTQSIAKATYYAPFGDTVDLTWMSPSISGTAEDTLGDATLIFSQDPMPVSGFAVALASQDLTYAQRCGVTSPNVPTQLRYVNLTWSAQTFLPVTGFGQYELERYDAVDGAWRQIMNASSLAVTGFADYEARVSIPTYYRIRTCNLLDFCGPWVTGGPITITGTGVTIGGDGNGLLMLTTNRQPTLNAAYTMNWENGPPIETFTLPEADQVQLSRMYGKDYFTAFFPTERGGEQFTRLILVNAGAISPPSLADAVGLRNLTYANVRYICVRDELGNRWFANVRVPEDAVRFDRTVYLATVQITLLTVVPDPIDPAVTT